MTSQPWSPPGAPMTNGFAAPPSNGFAAAPMGQPGQAQPHYASMNPDDFSEGSLVDECNLLIKAAKFDNFQFPGTPTWTIGAILTLTDDTGKDYEQVYSCGKTEEWQPSPDKNYLVAMGQKTQINTSTNWGEFLKSLVNCGFPKQMLQPNIQSLVGTYFYGRRVKLERNFGDDPTRQSRSNRPDPGTLLVSVLHNRPDEPSKRGTPAMAAFSPPPAGAQAAPPQAVAVPGATPVTPAPVAPAFPVAAPATAPVPAAAQMAAPAAPAVDISTFNVPADLTPPTTEQQMSEQAANWVRTYTTQMPVDTVNKQQMAQAAFVAFSAHPNRNNISTMLFDDNFLNSLTQAGWLRFDPATATLHKLS